MVKVKKGTIKNFHPTHYATGELESIARGGAPDAYVYSLRRSDVPQTIRNKAKKELERRSK